MLATAESCTGGLIAGACTDRAGSSQWFERGFVTYSNAAKAEMLAVPCTLIDQHGAVSEPVARAMAEGALAHSAAQASVAVTGVAGPTGGSADKPVGTVWLAWCVHGHTYSERQHFAGDRAAVRAATVRHALVQLAHLLGPVVPPRWFRLGGYALAFGRCICFNDPSRSIAWYALRLPRRGAGEKHMSPRYAECHSISPSFLRSLRGQLALWFGGLSLLMLLSVGLYVGRLATQQVATTAGASIHATARAAADLLSASLRDHELDMILLSLAPHFTRGDLAQPAVLHSLEQRRNLREEYAWMGVTDPQGTVVQAVDGILQGQSVAQRPWFIEGQAGLYAGDVHKALLLEKLLPPQPSSEPLRFIDIAAPIRNPHGALVGVIGAHIHWRWVTQTVQAAFDLHPQDQGTEILIANALGDVFYPQALVSHTRLAAAPPSAPTTDATPGFAGMMARTTSPARRWSKPAYPRAWAGALWYASRWNWPCSRHTRCAPGC